MKHLKLLLIALFSSIIFSYGQTTTIDFETLGSGYTPSATENTAGFEDVFNRTNPNIGGNNSFIWSTEDTSLTNPSIDLDQIDINGGIDFNFSIDMIAHHFNDWDNTDELLITYSIDGGAYQNLMWVQNSGDAFNAAASLDTDFNGDGDCGTGILPALTIGNSGCNVTNNTFETFTTNIIPLSSNSTLDIRLQFNGLTSADEGIYLDNIVVDVTPGTINTSVEFVSTTSTLAEDGVFMDVCVAIANEDATNATTVEINLDGTSTAINGTDYDDGAGTPGAISFPQSITFPAGSNANQCITIYISNDDTIFESSENVILNLQNATGGNSAILGTNTQHILTINDNDPNACSSIFSDDFSSGLTQWSNTGDWTTTAGELQHNITGVAGTSYISADIGNQDLTLENYEWSFCIRNGNWDPSTNNSFSFTLISSNANVINNTGYSVGVNQATSESNDLINLYLANNGAEIPIITGLSFDWGNSNDVCIRVTRSNTGNWELFYDDGSGELSAGTSNNTTYTQGSYIGSYFQYSSTRAGELWIDDVSICSSPLCSSITTWQTVAGITGWDNGVPNSTTSAVLNANYSTLTDGNITACSLTVNSGTTLDIGGNSYVEIENDVANNGNISVLTDGSFVQNSDIATFINNINDNSTVTKLTAQIDAWYEYTYWSSPVQGEIIQDVFFGTDSDRRFLFNGQNFKDAFAESMNDNTLVTGQDDVDDDANDWILTSGTDFMQAGTGYACTLSEISFNASGGMSGVGVPGSQFAHIFAGPFNNGVFNVPVYRNDGELADTNWNFIGNPYPSAISIDDFFDLNVYDITTNPNGTIEGAIYLWSQDTAPSNTVNGNSALNFDNSDYAIINIVGSLGALEQAGGDTVLPARFIPSGQGFFVSYDNNGASVSSIVNGDGDTINTGEVLFNNSIRTSGNNNQFFKNDNSQNTSSSNKLWLEFTSDTGIYGQVLVGYVPNATDSDDGMSYDALKNVSTGYSALMYSTIDGSSKKFGIQGKAPSSLDLDEEIPLGLNTNITEATLYKISILQFEGDFFSNNIVYLEDSLMNTVHDLSSNDYTFTSAAGEFNDRFKIVFNTNTLSTDSFETNSNNLSIIELQNDNVKFAYNGDLTIKTVEILDLLGRKIYNFRGSDKTETYNLSNISSSVYIAKIELSNGNIITKKAVKK